MYNKKASQPTPYNSNVNRKPNTTSQSRNQPNQRERVGSANKERPHQSSTNWFKEKDQQLLNLVKQYLQKNGYNRAFDVLKNQRPVRRIAHTTNSKYEDDNKSIAALQAFDKGERQQFFKLTTKIFQHTSDSNMKKMEFECQIYFCIYAIHPNFKKSSTISQKAKDTFRKYIETKGGETSNSHQQLLCFYALPYIPRPQDQPSLAHVFTKDWLMKLRNRIVDETSILNTSNSKQNGSVNLQGRKVTALQQIFYNNSNPNKQKQKEDNQKQNYNKYIMEAQQARDHNQQLLKYIDALQNNYRQFTQSSKSNLIESNVKWFQFARQLLSLVKKARKGENVNLEKYDTFLGRSVQQLIYGTNDISLFQKNSYFTEEVSINPTENRTGIHKKSQNQMVCQIDLNKVVQFLSQAAKPQKQLQVCLVLKALKDRFIKLKSPYARRQVIISYGRHDICGVAENIHIQKVLLLQSSQKVKEFYLRFLNYVTTDFYGISYLSSSEKLIQNIIGIFGTEHQYSVSRKYVLGILQRFSLLRKPQNLMISFGLIPMILRIFRSEKQQLSEYSRQYLTALIMNLSLRRASKTHFEKSKNEVVSILLSLTDSDDPNVKDYVNGALYSLVQSSSLIRQEAIRQQAVEKFKSLHDQVQMREKISNESNENGDNNTLIRQYQYIIDAFTGQTEISDQSAISDSQEDEQQGELDDIDEHDQDQIMSISSDSDQYVDGEDQYLTGQQLLLREFALVGPQAVREHLLTRSVLDETSKKIHNMTASINKSRRIDNIFSQNRPVTPSLLPELDK